MKFSDWFHIYHQFWKIVCHWFCIYSSKNFCVHLVRSWALFEACGWLWRLSLNQSRIWDCCSDTCTYCRGYLTRPLFWISVPTWLGPPVWLWHFSLHCSWREAVFCSSLCLILLSWLSVFAGIDWSGMQVMSSLSLHFRKVMRTWVSSVWPSWELLSLIHSNAGSSLHFYPCSSVTASWISTNASGHDFVALLPEVCGIYFLMQTWDRGLARVAEMTDISVKAGALRLYFCCLALKIWFSSYRGFKGMSLGRVSGIGCCSFPSSPPTQWGELAQDSFLVGFLEEMWNRVQIPFCLQIAF